MLHTERTILQSLSSYHVAYKLRKRRPRCSRRKTTWEKMLEGREECCQRHFIETVAVARRLVSRILVGYDR